ncbi:efflux RND transporter permease subunit [Gallaecimonas sp. GXIMD4217]|uniref:efflux RND transporter permease subunit n=1 Tax=Gallaecimonas sp. GXIMD4217 TaxID=3131927 RepID=UPI00311B10B1
MIAYFARHPTAANLLMIGISVLGLSVLPDLKRETFPEFSPSKVQVSVLYPGAATEQAEQALCGPMEEAVDGLGDVAEIQCEGREGMGTLTVEMREGGDIARLLTDIKTEIDAIDSFPDEAEAPVVKELGRDDPLITLAVSAELPDYQLKAYAEGLKDRLQRLPSIAMVDIEGFSDQQLKVQLSLPLLRQYGLSVDDVVARIRRQDLKLPSGTLESDDKTVLLRFDQELLSAEALGQLLIAATAEGGQLRLADVARVSEGFEKDEVKVWFDGKPAALLKIKKNKQQDALDLVAEVRAFVERERTRTPEGITLALTDDSAKIVQDRLDMLLGNAWQGLLLVFTVMWLFFAWRYAFWVAMGLPVSFLGALWLLAQLGVSINMISMVGLLMALGLLMDDAIVIAESIAAKVKSAGKVVEGAIEGVTLVWPGVLSSFLTTSAVFLGLAFIEGDIGAVMEVFPVVLLATLSVSLVEAFLILPNHLIHSLHQGQGDKEGAWKRRFNAAFERFRTTTLLGWVEGAVRRRYLVTGAVVAGLLLSMSLLAGGLLKFKAFPDLEGDVLELRLLLPQGTPLSQTERLVSRSLAELDKLNAEYAPLQPDGQDLIRHVTVQFNENLDAFEQGSHLATVRADLLTAELRSTSLAELKARWRQAMGEVPGALALAFKEPGFGPAGRPIEIRLHGDDLAVLQQASARLKDALSGYDGVVDVMDDLRPGKEEWVVRLKPSALSLGVDGALVAGQLRTAFFGQLVDQFQRGDQSLELDVRLRAQDRESQQQLRGFPITLADGRQIPLAAIADFHHERGYSRINRVDGQRTVTLIGDIQPGKANAGEIIAHLQQRVIPELLERHPGLGVSYEGEVKEGGKTGKSVAQKFLMGLVGVFLILSFQFRSYFEPLMVMLAIPLAVIGVIWGHLLLGYDFSIPSLIGFVSLTGIVVNDSILLVTYIKRHHGQGQTIHTAVVNAAKERFRAVFITTATTVAGMLPLLLETSLQAQVVQPLAVSLMFGLSTSTALVLFVLPGLYLMLEDLGLTSKHHLAEAEGAPATVNA